MTTRDDWSTASSNRYAPLVTPREIGTQSTGSADTEHEAIAALLIDTDGAVTELTLDPADRHGILTGMYRAIGCDTVEPVALADDLTAWFDENALCTANPVANVPVTLYLADLFHRGCQVYYGATLFTGGVDRKGNVLGLKPQWADVIRRYVTA